MKTELVNPFEKLYQQLKDDISEVIRHEVYKLGQQFSNAQKKSSGDWLTPAEAMQKLNIKRTKFFALKAAGEFEISQHGKKFQVSSKSIEEFMKRNAC